MGRYRPAATENGETIMAKEYKRFRSDVKKGLRKITATVSDESLEWFHLLSSTMKKSGGCKLPRTYIIRALINAAMTTGVNVRGVKTERQLEGRILRALR